MNSKKLRQFLTENGASEVGFADLSALVTDNMRSGVSIVLRIPRDIIRSISEGPNIEYYNFITT